MSFCRAHTAAKVVVADEEAMNAMTINNRASTGLAGLDHVIDMLRCGDNVVWQVGSISEYQSVTVPFVAQAKQDGRRVVYVRFGNHRPLLDKQADAVYPIDASVGFESFTTQVRQIISQEGEGVFYVFDCLSDLLESWYSDLMIGNFFQVTCPFLFDLDTVTYFALMRGTHTNNTIARIRGTTQLLLDLRFIGGKTYVHPLKAADRYSPTMFFPHLIQGDKAISITASSEAAALFSGQWQVQQARDYWEITLERARRALADGAHEQEQMKQLLINLIISREPAMARLADEYLTLSDLLYVASREIGSGFIGGKSVGFLLARRILDEDASRAVKTIIEPQDSYYLGSDIFYTYIVQNGCWNLRMKQKDPAGYFEHAQELKEALLEGTFPDAICEQFSQMLEYFGQSPIIVRSSSLQEDGYGNAFAGKYVSVFCANQGSPEDRYREFERAVKTVYASIMSKNALVYRSDRGLMDKDEQMAVLVQRVSGDHYGDLFFPHAAGVANSVNLYLWEPEMDPAAGMLRLVLGLGTRAVDRVSGDYAKIVALDRPTDAPPVNYGDRGKFTQHHVDVLDLRENTIATVPVAKIASYDLCTDKRLFFSPDQALMTRLREQGKSPSTLPVITDFKGLLDTTGFAASMQHILSTLEKAYHHPVDVEFTVNFTSEGDYRINILQCRPLQTRGLAAPSTTPLVTDANLLLKTAGGFMGGNINTSIDYVVFVKPQEYLALSEREKYQVARAIGWLDLRLRPHRVLLIGPGRWGSTTPSLGVPVHFSEIAHVTCVCEVAYRDMSPELSFGSHFFQDLVESEVFYIAIHDDGERVTFNPDLLMRDIETEESLLADQGTARQAIQVAKTEGLHLYSDVVKQIALCYFE